MITFSAKTLHDNPSEVYRSAVKEPVKITHKHHGDLILSAHASSSAYIYKQVADISVCYTGNDALAEIASAYPDEYMKHVTESMMRDYT